MKYVLITGASSGIGAAMAHKLAVQGFNLILVARRIELLNEMKKNFEQETKISCLVYGADLSDLAQLEKLFAWLEESNLQVEKLINNAGFGHYQEFSESKLPLELEMIDLNVKSLVAACKLVIQHFKKHHIKGSILNVASIAAFFPGPLMAVYYATKSFVLSFSIALRTELAAEGINVSALCPGPTESEFVKVAQMQRSKLIRGKKLPTSKEVAEFGLQKFAKNQAVIIPGFSNWLLSKISGLIPFSLQSKIIFNLNK